ncbi:hypothetical protein RAB80_017396 [Fusarium oxysporum f. sp. vasinfectum]|nr:hypothetical protein RAB80_017396 [Fusarium oxysporum f. sp. vasinfectum]
MYLSNVVEKASTFTEAERIEAPLAAHVSGNSRPDLRIASDAAFADDLLTSKEAIATQRLFDQLDLQLGQLPIIECDNQ